MPGNAEERTEAPTPRRREEARRKGQIARSHDLSSALLLLGGMLILRWLGPRTVDSLLAVMRRFAEAPSPRERSTIDAAALCWSLATSVLGAAGPIMAALLVLAFAAHLLQVGFLFTTEPLSPNLNRLNPINGFQRFFTTRTLVQLAMNLMKLTLVCLVGFSAVKNRADKIILALEVDGPQQFALLCVVIFEIGVILAVVLLIVAILDWGWQKWRHGQDLKMTKEEVKEELRRMEGDPMIKQRRRRMQLVAALSHIRKNVPQADVVVTNPTELAVAIRYDAEKMNAPVVIAKGANYLAQKIRETAIAHGVPIVERKPLAQALFKTVEVGQEVPEQFYKAIAEILAYVYELSGRARGMRRAPAA